MTHTDTVRKRIKLYGIVQGIGFRPFVKRLADELRVNGSVCNHGSFVDIAAEADGKSIEEFERRLIADAPPASHIVRTKAVPEEPLGETEFLIVKSRKERGDIYVSPDLAICPECEKELFDPGDRRYLHPFINCTNCGPRLTILDSMPYDRERTSMAEFPMCEKCSYEYTHPESRRFHAQPVCCHDDGPKLRIPGTSLSEEECIREVRRILKNGGIAAVKGIGGFHLACDASRDDAVLRLRTLKNRPMKPFAVMMRDMETVRRECVLLPGQEELLTGSEKPILLLERRTDGGQKLSNLIAPDNPTVGVMLPYAPVQHLLFRYPAEGETEPADDGFTDMLVMTSGNPSGAPICRTTEEAVEYLSPMCDVILGNNRKIRLRADDTVMRFADGKPYMIRRSRGYAPLPLTVEPEDLPGFKAGGDRQSHTVLAIGGELKNTFCLAKNDLYYMSPYVGDLGDPRSVDALQAAVERMETLLEIKPEAVVCDMHPLYNSSAFAKELGIPVIEIQHHYAHILSCMAENAYLEPVIGVSFDGTGYGTDGTIWGGEFLYCRTDRFERAGFLKPFRQAGGDLAAKEGWRIAVSLMLDAFEDAAYAENIAVDLGICSKEEFRIQRMMVEKGLNSVKSTSAGRLFDAVSAVLGIRRASTFEGEASIALEYAAEPDIPEIAEMGIDEGEEFAIKTDELIRALIRGRMEGKSTSFLAGGFHTALAGAVLKGCRLMRNRYHVETVALSGGVFQNMLFLDQVRTMLGNDGFRVLVHSQVPANDGGIALGQAVYGMNCLLT